ncbi:MAG: hypothetical protein WCV50_03105 [Patescibacteria group bacterium]|jgi:hypothetical protein
MPEQRPTNQCQYCGFPVEFGEHDCPNAPARTEEDSELYKNLSDTLPDPDPQNDIEGDFDFPEDDTGTLETIDAKNFRATGKEKVKKVLTRLVLWGSLTATSLVGLDIAYRQTDKVPKGLGEPLDELLYDMGVMETKAMTPDYKRADKQIRQMAQEKQKRIERITEFREQHKEDIEYLTSIYGEDMVNYFLGSFHIGEKKEVKQDTSEVAVVGFEEVGYSNEDFKKFIVQTHPQGWVNDEVDSIIYKVNADSVDLAMPEQYNMKSEKKAARARLKPSGVTSIDIMPTSRPLRDISDVTDHELGHAHDWRSDITLTPEERFKLFVEVTERYCQGGNAYHSDYVESITNEDEHQNAENRVIEYWAEICEKYFSDPDSLKSGHPEDFQIVDELVKNKYDNSFNPTENAKKRSEAISKAETKKDADLIKKIVKALPPETRTDIDILIMENARDMHRQDFLTDSFTSDNEILKQRIKGILSQHNISLPDNEIYELSNYIYNSAGKEFREHRKEWSAAMSADIINSLSPEMQNELKDYTERTIKELEANCTQENFSYSVFEKNVLQELESMCKKYGVHTDSKILIRVVLPS